MGSIKNMTELFVKAVYAEQQAGLGEAIGFFDVQFSPMILGGSVPDSPDWLVEIQHCMYDCA